MNKLKLLKGLIFIIILNFTGAELKGEPIEKENNLDICELYMDSKPIINYDLMFGDVIKASSFLVKDRKQPCINYSYSYDEYGRMIKKVISHIYSGLNVIREYKYDGNGSISEVIEQREKFSKKLILIYNNKNQIVEIRESVLTGADDPLFFKFDYLKYKLDSKGNIFEVKGVKDKFMGFSSEIVMLKAYDYDENNRLRAIRDFMNPKNTQIFSYGDYVNK